MGVECPHCGGPIEVTKCVDTTSAKPVDAESDLSGGIVKSVSQAIEEKVLEVDERTQALTGIHRLNQIANGTMSKDSDGLSAGWGGAMSQALKQREGNVEKVDPEELAGMDPERMDKGKASNLVQSLIMGSLSKESSEE